MKALTSKLSILLVIQLIIIVGFNLFDRQDLDQYPNRTLLDFDKDQIDKLVIKQGAESISLSRKNDQWQIAEQVNLRADENKVESALGQLATITINWPTTETASSHERFELTNEKNQRHIKLYQAGKLKSELLLGTSPGFKKVHARVPDEQEVYSIKLNAFDLPVKSNDWLDKQVLSLSELTQIKGKDFELLKNNDTWSLVEPQTQLNNTRFDLKKANQLAKKFNQLTIVGKAENTSSHSTAEESKLKLEVGNKNDKYVFSFYKLDAKYYASRSDNEYVFSISQSTYDDFAEFNQDFLLEKISDNSIETVMDEATSIK